MPNFTIYMREKVFRLMEELRSRNNLSRGKYLSMLVIRDAEEKGVRAKRT